MKPKKKSWYRSVNHAQEKRMYYAHKDLVPIRGKRSPRNLPDPYDDIAGCVQKTWKVKRDKQCRNRTSKIERTVILGNRTRDWELKEYLEEHNIPYRITEIKETEYRTGYHRKMVKDKMIPHFVYKYVVENKRLKKVPIHQAGYMWTYKYVNDYSKPYTYRRTYLSHYILTYWANKEIDFDKFLYL